MSMMLMRRKTKHVNVFVLRYHIVHIEGQLFDVCEWDVTNQIQAIPGIAMCPRLLGGTTLVLRSTTRFAYSVGSTFSSLKEIRVPQVGKGSKA